MTRELHRSDVLVLGLGPAGASAAAEAARRGCRVVAVDRKRSPGRPVQCAEFVPAMIGTAAIASSVRQRIRAMTTFVGDDAPDMKENFSGVMLDREAFDAALVGQAQAAGARCSFGVSVRRLDHDGRAELRDGTLLAARVVVGADGPHSIAGRAIGSSNAELVETRQITVPLHAAHDATDIFLSAGIPGGYGWLFPKSQVAHVGAGVAPPYRDRLKGIVAQLHSMLAAAGRVSAEALAITGGSIPVGGMLKPWGTLTRSFVLLAGDAAGLANPVSGAGIAAAVHSGRLAGEAAAAIVAGDVNAAAGYEEELDCVYRVALERAARRRRELMAIWDKGEEPVKAALRRGWIAYPEYWQ